MSDLREEIEQLERHIKELNAAVIETKTMLRNYNGLWKKQEWCIAEIKGIKSRTQGKADAYLTIRERAFLVVAMLSLIISIVVGLL